MRRWTLSGLLVAGCAQVPDSERADCNPIPAVVTLTREHLHVREGLETWSVEHELGHGALEFTDYRAFRERMVAQANTGIRSACNGQPEVLQIDDDVDGGAMFYTVVALMRGTEVPRQVIVSDDQEPLGVAPVSFRSSGVCDPVEPLRACLALVLDLGPQASRVRWFSRLIPESECGYVGSPRVREADSWPEAPFHRSCDRYDGREEAMRAALDPPSWEVCDDPFVTFDDPENWGQMRRSLARIGVQHDRVTFAVHVGASAASLDCDARPLREVYPG